MTSVVDIGVGSYRIWIHDLAQYFNELGIEASINELPDNIKSNLVIILGKSDIGQCEHYKKKYPNNIIGIINPIAGILYSADFIIVGSIEEKDSLAKNKNVFIFPLIEGKYRKIMQKTHIDKDRIIIGVHGSYTHLSKFNPHLKEAIEEFSKDVNILLRVITNPNAPKWFYGRPKIPNIKILDWNFKTFSKDVSSCDIGIVPNIVDNTPIFKTTSRAKGLYKTDYFFRMKNKSNSGRMFVFIQHGIPVIADLTPSNLHILGSPDNGFAVFSKDGWLNALRELSNAKNRSKISRNALLTFNSLYDPIEWAIRLANNIQEIEKYDTNN